MIAQAFEECGLNKNPKQSKKQKKTGKDMVEACAIVEILKLDDATTKENKAKNDNKLVASTLSCWGNSPAKKLKVENKNYLEITKNLAINCF